MDILKVFAGILRKYRKTTGLSQESFAEKRENVQRIADALGIDAYLLFIEVKNGSKEV